MQLSVDGIRSPYSFGGAIRNAVHSLKYRNLRALSKPLAQLMVDYWQSSPIPAEVLVPVPLHSRRLRQRGYNQSALLARDLGVAIGLPVDELSLMRRKDSSPQARTATAELRQRNVTAAFAVRGRKLKGKQVLLIDDVCTSGATLDSCAAALKRAGAESVWGLTLAKET